MEGVKWMVCVGIALAPSWAAGQVTGVATAPPSYPSSNAALLADAAEPPIAPAVGTPAGGAGSARSATPATLPPNSSSSGPVQHSTRHGDHRAFGQMSRTWSADNPRTLAFRANDYTTQGSRDVQPAAAVEPAPTPLDGPGQRSAQRVIPVAYEEPVHSTGNGQPQPPHPPEWAQPAVSPHEPIRSPHLPPGGEHDDLEEFAHTGHVEEHHDVAEVPAGKWFVAAEYLFARPRRSGMDFAVTDVVNGGVPNGDILDLEYEASSGARINFGYRGAEGHWQGEFGYTHFNSDDDELAVRPVGGTLIATATSAVGGVNNVDTALGEADLDMDIIDVGISRYLHLAEHITGRIYVGGRFATIDQEFRATYTGQSAGAGSVVERNNDLYAGGLRLMGEARTELWHDFSLFGRAGISLLAGHFDTSYRETNPNTAAIAVEDSFEEFVPVTEVAIGFTYHYKWLDLSVGYEITNWANAVDGIRLSDDVQFGLISRDTGDLVLSGLFARGHVDFGASDIKPKKWRD